VNRFFVNLFVFFILGSLCFSGSSFLSLFNDFGVRFNNGVFDFDFSDNSRLSFALSDGLFTFLEFFDA